MKKIITLAIAFSIYNIAFSDVVIVERVNQFRCSMDGVFLSVDELQAGSKFHQSMVEIIGSDGVTTLKNYNKKETANNKDYFYSRTINNKKETISVEYFPAKEIATVREQVLNDGFVLDEVTKVFSCKKK